MTAAAPWIVRYGAAFEPVAAAPVTSETAAPVRCTAPAAAERACAADDLLD